MSRFILWLESLTMEETLPFTYGCIFALALLMFPVAWFIDRKEGCTDEQAETASR